MTAQSRAVPADQSPFDFQGEFEQLQVLRDPRSGATAIIVIHDTRLGPAFGGIRRWRYPDAGAAVADALALAAAMTWKSAMAELPAGGGKAVLIDSVDLDSRAAYEFLGDYVEPRGPTSAPATMTCAPSRVIRGSAPIRTRRAFAGWPTAPRAGFLRQCRPRLRTSARRSRGCA